MKRHILAFSLLAGLAGCAAPATTSSASATVATVSATQATLAAAGRVILACYSVPACATQAPKPRIKAAYDNAYAAVTAAQTAADAGGSVDMTATAATMAVLQGLIAQLPIS